jgi:LDH2 family malate/lactate/ureidoglycolate dehydrogenase
MNDSDGEREIDVSVPAVRRAADTALARVGATQYERDTIIDALLAADQRGQHSHGLLRLPTIVARARAGLIVPGAMSDFTELGPSLGVLDGNFGFGHVTAVDACQHVGELARRTGVGVLVVRRCNQFGMLAHYLERLGRAGLVAIVLSTTEAVVRPAGGTEPLLGANPIGIAFPADPPFVLDMSTAATTLGKLSSAEQHGEQIPLGLAVDELGRPTDDPAAALRGAINSFGGGKGYGLGLAVELLAGALTGTATGRRVHGVLDSRLVSTKGDLFIVLDPRRLPWGDEVSSRATAYLAEVRRSSPADPHRPVLVPGDRGRARASLATRPDRIRLSRRLWSMLSLLAEDRAD